MIDPSSLADAELAFSVNVLAPLRLTMAIARHFWRIDREANLQRTRNVVNVSSTAGVYVYPDLGQACYAATKAALNHATYHLASELWDLGVRANAIAPNSFPGIVPTGRVLDEIIALDRSGDTGRLALVDAVAA